MPDQIDKTLANIINLVEYPLSDSSFIADCKHTLGTEGVLVLPRFLGNRALRSIQSEGEKQQHLAYYPVDQHNIYLEPPDPAYTAKHPRNREVISTKGCITTDQIPDNSMLHIIYGAEIFRHFLGEVLGENQLYEYADTLSSINLHYAKEGQELGWHFDNSSFAITLLIQNPVNGGHFQFVKDVRDADSGEMNYASCRRILDEKTAATTPALDPGSLVLFRGKNSLHRVTPAEGHVNRMLVVLAYNTEPGICLSESARMTFFGRLA